MKKSATPTVLISPTAYKSTLTPHHAVQIIDSVFRRERPDWKRLSCPLADGGDGTLEILSNYFQAKKISSWVRGPHGKRVRASWAYRGNLALIEMAAASGLRLVKKKNDVMQATSYGTGELIRAALKKGCRTIYIGVGGTATSEGGAGALQALGFRYFNSENKELGSTPGDLLRIHRIDASHVLPEIQKAKIIILCDVTNPLLGPRGSAYTFGPQKGATPKQVKILEKALRHWSRWGKYRTEKKPGAGAAGALAYGLSAFLGARLVRGSETIFQLVKWRNQMHRCDVIITGEGQLDRTSLEGKVIGEIIKKNNKKPLYVICGRSRLTSQKTINLGIAGVIEMGPQGRKIPRQALRRATQSLILKIRDKL